MYIFNLSLSYISSQLQGTYREISTYLLLDMTTRYWNFQVPCRVMFKRRYMEISMYLRDLMHCHKVHGHFHVPFYVLSQGTWKFPCTSGSYLVREGTWKLPWPYLMYCHIRYIEMSMFGLTSVILTVIISITDNFANPFQTWQINWDL